MSKPKRRKRGSDLSTEQKRNDDDNNEDEEMENDLGRDPKLSPSRKEWIDLAKIAQAHLHNRRDMEWKLAFGLWTGIGLFTAGAFQLESLEITPLASLLLAAIYIGSVIAFWCWWQNPLHEANAGDGSFYRYYLDSAQWVLEGSNWNAPIRPKKRMNHEGPDPKPNDRDDEVGGKHKWSDSNKQWRNGQVYFTALFLVLSWIAITQFAPAHVKAKEVKKANQPTASQPEKK